MFFVQHQCFWFQKIKVEKTKAFGQKGGCNKTVFCFFMSLCFAKCEKLLFFFAHFFGQFWLMFKKHYENRYFSRFLKAKKQKSISRCYYLGQVGVIIWAKLIAS